MAARQHLLIVILWHIFFLFGGASRADYLTNLSKTWDFLLDGSLTISRFRTRASFSERALSRLVTTRQQGCERVSLVLAKHYEWPIYDIVRLRLTDRTTFFRLLGKPTEHLWTVLWCFFLSSFTFLSPIIGRRIMGLPAGTKMVKSVEDADYLRSARYRNF